MKNNNLTIEIPISHYELAAAGELNVICCNFDPAADKDLQEGNLKPTEVNLKARGSRKAVLSFAVIGTDKVQRGYKVSTRGGRIIDTISRDTARVVIGRQISQKPLKDETEPVDS